MKHNMVGEDVDMKTQKERLDYLVEVFKNESDEYKDSQLPKETEGKRGLDETAYEIIGGYEEKDRQTLTAETAEKLHIDQAEDRKSTRLNSIHSV